MSGIESGSENLEMAPEENGNEALEALEAETPEKGSNKFSEATWRAFVTAVISGTTIGVVTGKAESGLAFATGSFIGSEIFSYAYDRWEAKKLKEKVAVENGEN